MMKWCAENAAMGEMKIDSLIQENQLRHLSLRRHCNRHDVHRLSPPYYATSSPMMDPVSVLTHRSIKNKYKLLSTCQTNIIWIKLTYNIYIYTHTYIKQKIYMQKTPSDLCSILHVSYMSLILCDCSLVDHADYLTSFLRVCLSLYAHASR